MLIENQLQGSKIKSCIIGIGLNVNQQQFLSDAPNPVSILQLTGKETDRKELLSRFLSAFEEAYYRKTISSAYRERLFRRGKESGYRDDTGDFTATLTDVTPDGRLVLQDTNGQERFYAFKEVQFII